MLCVSLITRRLKRVFLYLPRGGHRVQTPCASGHTGGVALLGYTVNAGIVAQRQFPIKAVVQDAPDQPHPASPSRCAGQVEGGEEES